MRNITLAVVVISWSPENTGVDDLKDASSAIVPAALNTCMGEGIPNSDKVTAFTPTILWPRGANAFSAFVLALSIASPKRSSFT